MKAKGLLIAAMAAAAIFLFISSFAGPSHDAKLQVLPLITATGPESLAFDPAGEGPYTGVSDGRIFKYSHEHHQWTQFAVSSLYMYEECAGSVDAKKEDLCGRPLGLEFNKKTGDLFVADAYKGLLKATHDERILKPVVTSAEGGALCFTNGLDIDQNSGVIYFTDSSLKYQRRQYMEVITSGDRTGRVMKYDPKSEKVEVLIHGLAFPNGVALSRDGSFLLVAETTTRRILKYKLKEKSVQVLVKLPGRPDNIRRSPRGGYWVALHSERENMSDVYFTVRIREDGKILKVLKKRFESISEVHERDGSLWIGSVVSPFVYLYKL